ncbi:MAG: 7TM diverse intracellular signaling domain-containing protein [Thermodesulfobacteriota bacterium]
MSGWFHRWGVTLVLAWAATLWPGAVTAQVRELVLAPPRESCNLGPYLEVLEDKNKKWTIQEVSSPEWSSQFRPWVERAVNFGLSSSAFWLRFRVRGLSGSKTGQAVAEGGSEGLDQWLFDPGEAIRGRARILVWEVAPPDRPKGPLTLNHFLSHYLTLSPGRPVTFYLSIESDTAMLLSPRVLTVDSYMKNASGRLIWLGLYYGVMLTLVLYYLLSYLSVLDRSYLWLGLFLMFLVLFFLGINGVAGRHLLAGRYYLAGLLSRSLLGMVIILSGVFTRSFLTLRRNAPLLDRIVLSYLAMAGLLVIGNPFLPARLINVFLILFSFLGPMITILAGVVCWKRGFRLARFFLLAWAVFILGALVQGLTFAGLLEYSAWRLHFFQFSSAIAGALFSFAFVDRVRAIRREKEMLKKKENRIRTIMDSIKSGVLLVDPKTGYILEANPEAARMIRAPVKEIVDKLRLEDLFPELGGRPSRSRKPAEEAELELVAGDGERVPVIESERVVTLDGKELILASLIDIAERKRLEEEREQLIRELQQALSEVTTLSGLLPICSMCKKIRDDKGYWNQIEAYISSHSEARFSHGLCPDCAKRLYPQVAERVFGRLEEKKNKE